MDVSSLSWSQILVRLTSVPMVVAAVLGVVRWRHLPRSLRYLTGLVWFLLPLDLIGLALMLQHRNNLFIMPIYTVGELAGLALVYGHALHRPAVRRALPWVVGAFAAYALLDSLPAGRLLVFRPGQQVVQCLLILALVGLHLRQLLAGRATRPLGRVPLFWVTAGWVVYALGYLQIALFSHYLLRYSHALNMAVWGTHSVLFILLYSCYILALCLPRPK